MADGSMVLLGGLWKSTTKAGVSMLSGKLTFSSKIVILPNTKKQPGDKQPDCNMFIASVERDQEHGGGGPDDSMI